MSNNNKANKRKVMTQRHVCSRMNFLYQAAQLMAHSNNNTLAAYYGKLCRNVGTKALMHMSPAVKRTLCKRCSLPLLPGSNTTLRLEQRRRPMEQQGRSEEQQQQAVEQQERMEEQQQQAEEQQQLEQQLGLPEEQQQRLEAHPVPEKPQASKRRKRRNNKRAVNDATSTDLDHKAQLYLECSLCSAKRRFQLDDNSECWTERAEAIVQIVTLDQQQQQASGGKEQAETTRNKR